MTMNPRDSDDHYPPKLMRLRHTIRTGAGSISKGSIIRVGRSQVIDGITFHIDIYGVEFFDCELDELPALEQLARTAE